MKNQIIKVSKKENSGIYGVKEGINLPFYHNRQTIGAVGITGPIDEVSKVGLVVKKMVEIMLDEQESLLNAYVNRQEIDELFEDIILKFNPKSLFVYNQKAKKHGCSLAGCRLLVAKSAAVADFEPFFNKAADVLAGRFRRQRRLCSFHRCWHNICKKTETGPHYCGNVLLRCFLHWFCHRPQQNSQNRTADSRCSHVFRHDNAYDNMGHIDSGRNNLYNEICKKDTQRPFKKLYGNLDWYYEARAEADAQVGEDYVVKFDSNLFSQHLYSSEHS